MPSSKWMNSHAFTAFMLHSSSLKGATFSCFVTTLCCTASSNHQTIKPINHKTCMDPRAFYVNMYRSHKAPPRKTIHTSGANVQQTAALENSIKTRRAQKILGISPALLVKLQKTKLFFFSKTTESTFASMPSMPSHGAPQYNWHLLEYLEPNT